RRHPPRPVPQRARRTVAPARLRPPGRRGPPPPGPFAAAGPDAAAVRGHGAGRGDTGGRSVKALELDGVHAGYGPARVLRGVDLTVPDGATVALLGANGAGKTTLLRAAAGLLPVSAGTVRLAGRPAPAGADARARAGLCLIPEGRGVFPRLTVEENVALFAGGRRRREEAFDRVTAVFPGLGQRRHQVAGTLSGGQQQMLAFSRALCTDAALVLADELSFGLAPIVLDELFEAVAGLRRHGRSVLVVEQFVDRVLGLADWIYVLDKGTVTFVGEPAQLADGGLFDRYLGSGRR